MRPRAHRVRELGLDARTIALLARTFAPKLVKGLVDDLAPRTHSRSLKLGAFAVAGAAAAGLVWRYGPFGGDAPQPDTA